MSRIFTKTLSRQEFIEKLCEVLSLNPKTEENLTDYHISYILEELRKKFPKLKEDLNKVSFNTENLYIDGIDVLENGLAFLGVKAGGDWEFPIYMIVYYDGKKFRGYIWNTDTFEAYGNNDEKDSKNIEKRYGIKVRYAEEASIKFDAIKMREDILKRIIKMNKIQKKKK